MSGKTANLRPFPPGVSGNPGGKTKQDLEVEMFAKLNAKLAIQVLVKAMSEAPLMSDRINAAKLVLERGYGKPKEHVTVKHERPIAEWLETDLDNAIAELGNIARKAPSSEKQAKPH